MISSAINSVREAVSTAAAATVDFASRTVDYCGRKVEDLTDAVLPATIAKIVRAVLYSLPVTVAALYAPTWALVAAGSVYLAGHTIHAMAKTDELPVSKNVYENVATGIGNALTWSACTKIAENIQNKTAVGVVGIAVKLVAATALYLKGADYPVPHLNVFGITPKVSADTAELDTGTPKTAPTAN